MKLKTSEIQTMLTDFDNQSYNPQAKERWVKLGRKLARIIVAELGLSKDQYKINVNRGGIAVGAAVNIYTPKVWINLEPSCLGGGKIMWRTCDGLGDSGAGMKHINQFELLTQLLLDIPGFVKRIQSRPRCVSLSM